MLTLLLTITLLLLALSLITWAVLHFCDRTFKHCNKCKHQSVHRRRCLHPRKWHRTLQEARDTGKPYCTFFERMSHASH